MDNNEIEVLDDFELDSQNNNQQSAILGEQHINAEQTAVLNNQNQNTEIKNEATPVEPVTSNEKKEEENPVVEMINNKTTMRLIAIMLVVLFIAVFFMPKIFELIGTI